LQMLKRPSTTFRNCYCVKMELLIYLSKLFVTGADIAEAKRLEGVNKPELLPKEFTTVIDVAGFLSAGQVSSYSLGIIFVWGAPFNLRIA
jgi:hypothetical protein